jgi:uncharacterized membrane protein YoaK (UPF0700 family)
MLRQLPRWAWIGGGLLASAAGCINAVGYLCFRHQPVTHLTGTSTMLGIALAHGDGVELLHWAATIASFVLGAMLSGFIVQQRTLQLGRRYGVVLTIESLLLFAATPLIHDAKDLGLYLASAACGLQNAMVSTYSGATLRIHVCLLVASAFIVGATLGALGFTYIQERVLLIPAVLTGVVGLGYAIYRHFILPRPT